MERSTVYKTRMNPEVINSIAWKKIESKIRSLYKEDLSFQAIAKIVGVSKATIKRWYDGDSGGEKTAFIDILKYLERLDIDISEIFNDIQHHEFEYIPKVKATLGAGASLVASGDVKQAYAFRKEFVQHIGKPSDLVLFEVVGDSMQPTLEDGDTVLINKSDKHVINGKLYACRIDNELMVKKLFKEPGRLRVVSENESHGEFCISISNESQEEFDIIGRIRWVGRVV